MEKPIPVKASRDVEGCFTTTSPSSLSIDHVKKKISKELGLKRVIKNSELLRILQERNMDVRIENLKVKPVRSLSGVNVVAAMMKPFKCPENANCIYCPGGIGSPFGDVPQSYTGREPAALRAIEFGFNPYLQVKNRLDQFKRNGHPLSKIELIIMGGTFFAAPKEYRAGFIKGCLDAIIGEKTKSITETMVKAEKSRLRNVGITIETRPDYCKEENVKEILGLGVTRVELGVQTIYDDVFQEIKRGHGVKEVVEATKLLKDNGLKVCYHLMPGLPGSDFDRDIKMFREIFENEAFKPDMIKIYPTLVMKGTILYKLWRENRYKPYEEEEVIELIAEIKKFVPSWVRIMRVNRDIPSNMISAGVKKTNLRQIVLDLIRKRGYSCKCIRCREVGLRNKNVNKQVDVENVEIKKTIQDASHGKDIFISAETSEDILLGFIRARIPSNNGGNAIIRELHVYGSVVPLGGRNTYSAQHRGLGRKLLRIAEETVRERFSVKKMKVLSGLGVKEYYRRLGYGDDGFYMSKELS